MKRPVTAAVLTAILLISIVAFAVDEPPLSRATVQPREAPAQSTTSAIRSEAAEPVEPEGTGRLAGYVLTAILAWDEGVQVSGARTRLAAIARDVAWIGIEQPRIWRGSDGAREAILLAKLAWFESRLRDYVDDGRCQSWAAMCMTYANGVPYCDFAKLPKGEPRDSMMLGTCDGGRRPRRRVARADAHDRDRRGDRAIVVVASEASRARRARDRATIDSAGGRSALVRRRRRTGTRVDGGAAARLGGGVVAGAPVQAVADPVSPSRS